MAAVSACWSSVLSIFLWAISWAIAWLALSKDPAFAQQYLASQGMSDPAALFQAGLVAPPFIPWRSAVDAGDPVAGSGISAL